jgi:hypothetical protein
MTLGLLAAFGMCGCASDDKPQTDAPATVPRDIDPIAGTLGAVSFGDDRKSIEKTLGDGRVQNGDPIWPTGAEDLSSSAVPPRFAYPRGRRLGEEPVFVRYPTITAMLVRGRLHLIAATTDGTHAGRGLKIGDPLSEASRAYPNLQCGRAAGPHGDDLFSYCTGPVANGRYLWAGGDPIRSFAVAKGPMSG